jgi:hypothetical protein
MTDRTTGSAPNGIPLGARMRNPSTSNEDISVVVQDKKTKDAPQSVISATQSDWQSIVDEIKALIFCD